MSAILNEPALRLRPMRAADLPAVMTIELRAYPYPWTEGIFRDCLRVGYSCWLLEDRDSIAGYGVMSVGAGEAHILNLCVASDHRGKGHGRKILTHLLYMARRLKADTALLEVRPSNAPALHLYHSLGFNEVGMRRDYYPDKNGREDALILAKAL
jgi:[ribosomal protein S18]-alanine N-acetyltransferase